MQGIKEFATTLATLSDLPAFLVSSGEVEVIRMGYFSHSSLGNIYRTMFRRRLGDTGDSRLSKVPKLLRVVNEFNLSTLVVLLSVKPVVSAVFGPFFMNTEDHEGIVGSIIGKSDGRVTRDEAEDLVGSISIKDSMFIQAWARTVNLFLGIPATPYVKVNTIHESSRMEDEVPTISENRINETVINSRYIHEREIKQLLKLGDSARLKKLLVPRSNDELAKAKSSVGTLKGHVGPNSLRNEKNLAITLNTMFRGAADDAGLPPVYIHSISEKTVSEIEKAGSSDDLIGLIDKMIDNYCNSINNAALKNHSVNIVRVQRYIMSNIDKRITLNDLREITGLDESYLCRLFKRECGVTINTYIQERRISEAKRIMETTDTPISEVSQMLGFSSQSYFCSVFKGIVGMSPSKYRQNRGNYYKA